MRRLFVIVLSLLALEGAARAADLPPAPELPPLEAQPTWSGFYAGLNVGGGFGSSHNAFNIAGLGLPAFDTKLAGVVGGGEAGYNWQTGPWVLGLEASFDGSGLSGGRTAPCPPPLCPGLAASYTQRLSWFGTLRPRVGYAFGNWLFYATGGGACWRGRHERDRGWSAPPSPLTIAAIRERAGRSAAASKSRLRAAGAPRSNIFISISAAARGPILRTRRSQTRRISAPI